MKKIAFTLQVFSLIILVPAFAAIELNHEIGGSSQVIRPSNNNEAAGKPVLPASENFKAQDKPTTPVKTKTISGKQQCNNPRCTCKKCTCGSNCTCNDSNIQSSVQPGKPPAMGDPILSSKPIKK